MRFSGTSVRSLTKILKKSGSSRKVRFTVPIENVSKELLGKIGFEYPPSVGDYLIPSDLGKFTKFNAKGRTITRKDLPKKPEMVSYYGTSTDWHGGKHSGTRSRTIDKYPREDIPAPSETLEIIELDGNLFISSSELNLDDEDETRNIHVTNVMLECFSRFEIFDIEKQNIIGPKLKRLHWEILPPGKYPWKKSKSIISEVTEKLDEKDKIEIERRMKFISDSNPDFLAIGKAGFSGYFVFGFNKQKVYVLESVYLDNATYVFSSNWESLSQLTKSQIINSELEHTRIIHKNNWKNEVNRAIDGS